MRTINDGIALDLASLLHPVRSPAGVDEDVDLALMASGVASGDAKFLDLRSAWRKDFGAKEVHASTPVKFYEELAKACAKRAPRKDLEMRQVFSLNTHIVVRGFHAPPTPADDPYLSARRAIAASLHRGYKFALPAPLDASVDFTFSSAPALSSRDGHNER